MLKLTKLERELLTEAFPNEADYSDALKRLENREPLAYILGYWFFYDEKYKVSPDCLIPRPETEHLVERLIELLPQNGCFADLCTGSGCIAVSVLVHRPDLKAVAIDISDKALKIAAENASLNNVSDRITFECADVLNGNVLNGRSFDAIVSNPPYIVSSVIPSLEPEVLCEPEIALDGGDDGLLFYRSIFGKYVSSVKKGGYIVCEIGYDQGDKLKELFGCSVFKDYSGNDRVAILKI